MHSELIRVSDFCRRYSISRATFYRLVQRGELTIVKIGAASRIRSAEAEAWSAALSADAAT